MPQLNVTIAGRVYRMACGEGEEGHLINLAERLDRKINQLRGDFGEIGDQRITVMAALTMADDLSEAERRIEQLQTEIAVMHDRQNAMDEQADQMGDAVAVVLEEAATRIDRVAHGLLAGVRSQP